MKKRTVVFYRTSNGKCPVEDFLDSLPGKIARKILWVLRLLEELEFVPASHLARLSGTDEIWECKIRFASNSYRILCFVYGNFSIVLTHGFIKKTKKTPRAEIGKAEVSKKDFIKRKAGNERC